MSSSRSIGVVVIFILLLLLTGCTEALKGEAAASAATRVRPQDLTRARTSVQGLNNEELVILSLQQKATTTVDLKKVETVRKDLQRLPAVERGSLLDALVQSRTIERSCKSDVQCFPLACMKGTCQPLQPAGSFCAGDEDCISTICGYERRLEEFGWIDFQRVCVEPGSEGMPCDGSEQCAEGLSCVKITVPDIQRGIPGLSFCTILMGEGSDCTATVNCATGTCTDGVCGPPPTAR